MSDPVEIQPTVIYASRRKWSIVGAAAGVVVLIFGLTIERTTELNGITAIGIGIIMFVTHGCIALWAHRKTTAARHNESLTLAQDLESDEQ